MCFLDAVSKQPSKQIHNSTIQYTSIINEWNWKHSVKKYQNYKGTRTICKTIVCIKKQIL